MNATKNRFNRRNLHILTSASVHGSQVAIPLMKLTSSKITYCYVLMDAAYDAR